MRRIALTVATAIALALAAVVAGPVSASSSGVLATGSFTLVFGGGSHRTFSFVVQGRADGTVTGQAQFITRGGDSIHIDINCFTRVGNQAIIGGTSDSVPWLTAVAWAIEDDPDIAEGVFYTGPDDAPQVTCENMLQLDNEPDISGELNDYGFPLQQGNLMISR